MAMAAQGPLEELYFGFNLSLLLLRIDTNRPARSALADFDVWRVGFVEPAGFEILVTNPGRADQRAELLRNGVPVRGVQVPVGIEQIAELAVPFDALGVAVEGHLQFFVELLRDGQSQDRAPREGAIVLTRPSRDFEQIMWNV
jgi:hypothetical protein